ncbi:MAG TPA: zeta toxin family protein [Mucilaginibacter sp.]|jgi:predicted ABC-type ATPase|nr:zeta toxin family protein [Mucilaginibacter sp.]
MPKENPQLTIVGGPNGAGKSTYSGGLSPMGAFVFDADIITARVAAQLPPDVPVESIYFAVQSVFLDFVEEAIKKKRHFTIETNFRDNELMDTIARFKQNGYDTSMIYLTLNDVEQSIDRVKQRVSTGGHFVDEASIRYNFEEGLKNLEYFSDRFDNLEVIEVSKRPGQLRTLLKIKEHQLVYLSDDLPLGMWQTIMNIADRFNSRGLDNDETRGPTHGRGR